ncbi:MAG: hypothetical protein AAFR65_09510 [Pseudomonadota bacterium]
MGQIAKQAIASIAAALVMIAQQASAATVTAEQTWVFRLPFSSTLDPDQTFVTTATWDDAAVPDTGDFFVPLDFLFINSERVLDNGNILAGEFSFVPADPSEAVAVYEDGVFQTIGAGASLALNNAVGGGASIFSLAFTLAGGAPAFNLNTLSSTNTYVLDDSLTELSTANPIPVPGAALLFPIGLGALSFFRKKTLPNPPVGG